MEVPAEDPGTRLQLNLAQVFDDIWGVNSGIKNSISVSIFPLLKTSFQIKRNKSLIYLLWKEYSLKNTMAYVQSIL